MVSTVLKQVIAARAVRGNVSKTTVQGLVHLASPMRQKWQHKHQNCSRLRESNQNDCTLAVSFITNGTMVTYGGHLGNIHMVQGKSMRCLNLNCERWRGREEKHTLTNSQEENTSHKTPCTYAQIINAYSHLCRPEWEESCSYNSSHC